MSDVLRGEESALNLASDPGGVRRGGGQPEEGFHFHTGRPLALMLEYQDEWLIGIPESSIELLPALPQDRTQKIWLKPPSTLKP